jgi:hypothetical protein
MKVERFATNPLITAEMDKGIGTNINGPSLLRVPEWLPNPLGRYYLYFAHHNGEYIRLAYADALEGPWHIYGPGTLRLEQTVCVRHIASPDVHVDDEARRIVLYFHGPVEGLALDRPASAQGGDQRGDQEADKLVGWGVDQRSFVATSSDGIHFAAQTEVLGPSYFRVFRYGGWVYALSMPGIFLRSRDGFTGFTQGPTLFNTSMRHAAVRVEGDTLTVFYSTVGDCPEHIKVASINLRPEWMEWKESEAETALLPERDYEGGHLALEPSRRGPIFMPVRQLRDPGVYEEIGRTYLFYSLAGEQGIAGAYWES